MLQQQSDAREELATPLYMTVRQRSLHQMLQQQSGSDSERVAIPLKYSIVHHYFRRARGSSLSFVCGSVNQAPIKDVRDEWQQSGARQQIGRAHV